MDGQIPVVRGQLPAAVLIAFEFGLVGKELFSDLVFGLPWRRVGGDANDDDTIVPAGILTGVKARGVNREVLDVTKLLLPFEDGDLILLEDGPPLVFEAVFRPVDPLFYDGFRDGRGGRGCLL